MRIEPRWCALLAVSVMVFGSGCETTQPAGEETGVATHTDETPAAKRPGEAAEPGIPPRKEPAPPRPAVDHAGLARKILSETGVKGGLVVHLGCGDGKLTAALRANDSYLVQGLDADEGNV